MSLLLSQWLNTELQISTTISPTELDSYLKSGYILGEILTKLELTDTFPEQFSKSLHPASFVKNYSLIERILKDKLNIQLSSNEAFDLIQGKTGCAAKLLYQIKSAHARLPTLDPIDKKLMRKTYVSDTLNAKEIASYPASPVSKFTLSTFLCFYLTNNIIR
jgi:hypothetical protein